VCYLIIAIFNIALSIPLIKLWGPLGSAVSVAICYTIGHIIIMNIYYKKVMGLDIGRFWFEIAKMLPAVIVPSVLLVLFMKVTALSGRMGFLIYGVVFVLIYGLCMMLFGLNKEEKRILLSRF